MAWGKIPRDGGGAAVAAEVAAVAASLTAAAAAQGITQVVVMGATSHHLMELTQVEMIRLGRAFREGTAGS